MGKIRSYKLSQLNHKMDATITLEQLMVFVLFLLAVGLGVFLIIAMKNIANILKQVNRVVDENANSIDTILSEAPVILANVNKITGDVQETLELSKPSITNIVKNVDTITDDVTEVVDKVTHTVDIVGEGIEDTVDALNENKGTIINYLNIILELGKVLKKVFAK